MPVSGVVHFCNVTGVHSSHSLPTTQKKPLKVILENRLQIRKIFTNVWTQSIQPLKSIHNENMDTTVEGLFDFKSIICLTELYRQINVQSALK